MDECDRLIEQRQDAELALAYLKRIRQSFTGKRDDWLEWDRKINELEIWIWEESPLA